MKHQQADTISPRSQHASGLRFYVAVALLLGGCSTFHYDESGRAPGLAERGDSFATMQTGGYVKTGPGGDLGVRCALCRVHETSEACKTRSKGLNLPLCFPESKTALEHDSRVKPNLGSIEPRPATMQMAMARSARSAATNAAMCLVIPMGPPFQVQWGTPGFDCEALQGDYHHSCYCNRVQ